jgi:hypothetical protein
MALCPCTASSCCLRRTGGVVGRFSDVFGGALVYMGYIGRGLSIQIQPNPANHRRIIVTTA